MARGQVIPGYVYDEIDTYIGKQDWESAGNNLFKAIDAYQDKKLNKYNCLWLYHRGIQVAEGVGAASYVISCSTVFLELGENLLRMEQHEKDFFLRHAKIRPPRHEEIEQARKKLAEHEEDYIKNETEIRKRSLSEVEQEIKKFRSQFTLKGGGCMVPLFVILIGLVSLTAIFGILW